MKDGDYLAIFQQLILPLAMQFNPSAVIVSAGFDCALGCPEVIILRQSMEKLSCHNMHTTLSAICSITIFRVIYFNYITRKPVGCNDTYLSLTEKNVYYSFLKDVIECTTDNVRVVVLSIIIEAFCIKWDYIIDINIKCVYTYGL